MALTEELSKLQLDLVELVRGGSRSRPMFQVRIERDDGAAVSVDDCARASRAIEARLDADRIAGERYVLEVSSPGVERRLRGPADWRRFVGRRAKVLSDALGGREEVEIIGVSGEPGSEVVVLRTPRGGGSEQSIPLAEVKEARLAFHW
ncbi:MAG: ribosome maturation factor RimP [Gemmatimonadaceae bacterium]